MTMTIKNQTKYTQHAGPIHKLVSINLVTRVSNVMGGRLKTNSLLPPPKVLYSCGNCTVVHVHHVHDWERLRGLGREEKHGTEEEEGRGNPPPIGRRSGGKSPPGGNSPPFGTTWWGGRKSPPGGIFLPLKKTEMTYRGGIPYPLKRRSRKLRKLSLYVQNLCFTLISHPTTSVLKRQDSLKEKKWVSSYKELNKSSKKKG